MVAQTLIYFDDRFSNKILNQLISAATWWTRVRHRPMARRDPGRPCFPPMAPKRVNNKYPRSIVEARVFTVPVFKSSRDISHLRRGTLGDLREEALANFRNSLPPRIARADAAIRIGTRPPRSRRRSSLSSFSPLARTTRVSPMRPNASRPARRQVAHARVWARSCAYVRAWHFLGVRADLSPDAVKCWRAGGMSATA